MEPFTGAGSLAYGLGQETPDFLSPDPFMTQGGVDLTDYMPPAPGNIDFGESFVPQGLMQELMGLKMPERDELGYYGITDSQRRDAQFRSLGDSLSMAAQGFVSGNPNAFLKMGDAYNQREETLMEKYSKNNVNDIIAKMSLGTSKINAAKGLSDLTKADIERQKAEIEWREKKGKVEGYRMMMEEFAVPMNYAVNEVAKADPKAAATLKATGIAALEAVRNGNIDQGMKLMGMMQELTSPYPQLNQTLPDMLAMTAAEAAVKRGANAEQVQAMIDSLPPEMQGRVSVDIGPDGMLKIIGVNEKATQALEIAKGNAYVNAQNANAEQSRAAAGLAKAQAQALPGQIKAGSMQRFIVDAANEVEAGIAQLVSPDMATRTKAYQTLAGYPGFSASRNRADQVAAVQGFISDLEKRGIMVPKEFYMAGGNPKLGLPPSVDPDLFYKNLASPGDVATKIKQVLAIGKAGQLMNTAGAFGQFGMPTTSTGQ